MFSMNNRRNESIVKLTVVDDIRPQHHQSIHLHLARMTLTSSLLIWKYAISIVVVVVRQISRYVILAKDIPWRQWEGIPRPLAAQLIVSRMIGRCKSRRGSVGQVGINTSGGRRRRWSGRRHRSWHHHCYCCRCCWYCCGGHSSWLYDILCCECTCY